MLLVYTDALEEFWATMVTKTIENQVDKTVQAPQQEPIAILGASFTTGQKPTTCEKEAYSVLQTFD